MAATQRRMARERQFARRIEYPHAVIGVRIGRRKQESGFGKAQPLCQLEHLFGAEAICVMHHRERIAAQRTRTKYVDKIEFHGVFLANAAPRQR